ncbi:MAG: TRAP transporter small permease [Betaproteobacteria bacterium]|nr:MAG: TRAP transporter small permease [Betaproteobacteria bacterium]TAG50295.1 MAG: TRAP transporter small permease [Betaproteobacteria bacterium]
MSGQLAIVRTPARLEPLLRAHDRLTSLGVQLAMLALAVMVGAYVLEVVARYAFDAPTRWSADLVSYLLLFIAFMAMPQVTASGGHVAVTALLEQLSPARQRSASRVIAMAGAAVCVLLGWIALQETLRQASGNVRMMAAYPVPKAWISVWIIYGLASSALYFLRHALWPQTSPVQAEASL